MNGLEIMPHCNRCSCVIALSWGQLAGNHQSSVRRNRGGGGGWRHVLHYAMANAIVHTYGSVKLMCHLLWLFFSLPRLIRRVLVHHWVWVCHMCLGLSRWGTERWIRAARGATGLLQLDCCQVRPTLPRGHFASSIRVADRRPQRGGGETRHGPWKFSLLLSWKTEKAAGGRLMPFLIIHHLQLEHTGTTPQK